MTLCRQPRPVGGPAAQRARSRPSSANRGRASTVSCSRRCAASRLEIARERHVPPYVIFHDRTLREMARLRPRSLDELQQVHGVGARRSEQFGQRFLDVIRDTPG